MTIKNKHWLATGIIFWFLSFYLSVFIIHGLITKIIVKMDAGSAQNEQIEKKIDSIHEKLSELELIDAND